MLPSQFTMNPLESGIIIKQYRWYSSSVDIVQKEQYASSGTSFTTTQLNNMEKRNGTKEWSSNDASLQNIVAIDYKIGSANGENSNGGGNSILEIYGKNEDGSGSETLIYSLDAKSSGKSVKAKTGIYSIPIGKVVTRIYAKVTSSAQANHATSTITAIYAPNKSWGSVGASGSASSPSGSSELIKMDTRLKTTEWTANERYKPALSKIKSVTYKMGTANSVNSNGGGSSILEIYGKDASGSGSESQLFTKTLKTNGKQTKSDNGTFSVPSGKIITKIYVQTSSSEQENRATATITANY